MNFSLADAVQFNARRFLMVRQRDVSGVSGTGVVAEGVVFSQGMVVLHWLVEPCSVAVYMSVNDLVTIHGHNGATDIQFIDHGPAGECSCRTNGG